MKMRINKYGELSLERAGKMEDQFCPYHQGRCSHVCPLFNLERTSEPHLGGTLIHITLFLCNSYKRKFNPDDVIDEREVQNEKQD